MVLSLYRAANRERAAVAALTLLDRELVKRVNDATRDVVVPLTVRAVTAEAESPVMARIAASGRFSAYRGTPGVAFGGSRAVTSTGVPGRVLVRGLEFGSPGQRFTTYSARRRGGGAAFTVRRRATRQFMPDRVNAPTAVYPGVESVEDDVLAVWLEVVEDAAVSALDGEG